MNEWEWHLDILIPSREIQDQILHLQPLLVFRVSEHYRAFRNRLHFWLFILHHPYKMCSWMQRNQSIWIVLVQHHLSYWGSYFEEKSIRSQYTLSLCICQMYFYIFNNFLTSQIRICIISWRLGSVNEKNRKSACWESPRARLFSSVGFNRYRYVTGIQWVLIPSNAEFSKISSYTPTNWSLDTSISMASSSCVFLWAATRDVSHLFTRHPGI